MVEVWFEPRQSDPGSITLTTFSSLASFLPEEEGCVVRMEGKVGMPSYIFLVELESILLSTSVFAQGSIQLWRVATFPIISYVITLSILTDSSSWKAHSGQEPHCIPDHTLSKLRNHLVTQHQTLSVAQPRYGRSMIWNWHSRSSKGLLLMDIPYGHWHNQQHWESRGNVLCMSVMVPCF